MERQGDKVHINEQEVSGGSKEGVVRWILGIGLVLAIAFMSIIWITGALSQDDVESEITVDGNIDAMESETGTDGLVGDRVDDMDANADLAPVEGVAAETVENQTEN